MCDRVQTSTVIHHAGYKGQRWENIKLQDCGRDEESCDELKNKWKEYFFEESESMVDYLVSGIDVVSVDKDGGIGMVDDEFGVDRLL